MTTPYVQMVVYDNEPGNTHMIQDIMRWNKADLFMKNGHPNAAGRFMFERMIEEAEAGHPVSLETGFEDSLETLREVMRTSTSPIDTLNKIHKDVLKDFGHAG